MSASSTRPAATLLPRSVIYADSSTDPTLLVLDLPLSITESQSHCSAAVNPQFRCPPAATVPFCTPEPKTAKARERVLSRIPEVQRERDDEVCEIVETALQQLRGCGFEGPWCFERKGPAIYSLPPLVASENDDDNENVSQVKGQKRKRAMSSSLPLNLCNTTPHSKLHLPFFLPPQTHVIRSSLEAGLPLLTDLAFTHLLVDPPHPNRSARHASAYRTDASPLQELQCFLTSHKTMIVPGAVIAIWTTNSARAWTASLAFIRALGAQLQERWIWVKITAAGEPIVPVRGLWRRTWEVCLVARVLDAHSSVQPGEPPIRTRVLFCSPAYHSMKPGIHALLTKLLPAPRGTHPANLEVFARFACADWWALGDDAGLFNQVEYWTGTESTSDV